MRCRCGNCSSYMDLGFMNKLQEFRDLYGQPLSPSSGVRCEAHNQYVGGSLNSYHLLGRAVDIPCTDAATRGTMIALALDIFGGIGINSTFLHFDDRETGGDPIIFLY